MVRSGTRNAWAISAVPRPDRLRRVSATWASRLSAGMAAGEHELQALVRDLAVARVGRHGLHRGHLPQPRRLGRRAAHPVDGPVTCRGGEPRERLIGHARLRPLLERPRERVLGALLGQVPVAAGEPDHGGHDPAPPVGVDPGDKFVYLGCHGSPACQSLLVLAVGPERAQFDRPGPRHRVPGRDVDRLVQVGRTRGCRSRRSGPWFPHRARRSATPSRLRTRTVVASLAGRVRLPITLIPLLSMSATQSSTSGAPSSWPGV